MQNVVYNLAEQIASIPRGFDPQPDPPKCAATLAFADFHGNPVGPTKTINLAAGSFAVVDLDPGLLPASGDPHERRYGQPRLSLPAVGGDPCGCSVSVQVCDRVTGWTTSIFHAQENVVTDRVFAVSSPAATYLSTILSRPSPAGARGVSPGLNPFTSRM